MRDDQLFGLVALLAILFWLGSRLVPEAHRSTVERLAFLLLGGGLVAAVVMSILHFTA